MVNYKIIFAATVIIFGSSSFGMKRTREQELVYTGASELNKKLKLDFFDAVKRGDTKTVAHLLDTCVYVNTCDNDRYTALDWAVTMGYEKLVTLLLDKGANVNKTSFGGDPLLQVAVKKGYKEIVAILLDKGADVNARGHNGLFTALYYAAGEGHKEVVAMLLDKGAEDIDALHRAIWAGHKEIIALFLDAGADINARDTAGFGTAFDMAVGRGNKEIAILLIDRGAAIDSKDNLNDNLIRAARAQHGCKDVMALLLDLGADVNARDRYGSGMTALGYVIVDKRDKELATMLIAKGADINAKFVYFDYTVLSKVVDKADREMLAFVLDKGADIDSACWGGQSSLLKGASQRGDQEMVQLLELCTQVEVREYLEDPQCFVNKHGLAFTFYREQTILMLACIFGHIHIINMFAEHPIEFVNAQDNYKHSSFDYAVIFNLDSVAHLINIFGDKIDSVKGQKNTLLKQAIEKGHIPLIIAVLSIGAIPQCGIIRDTQDAGYLNTLPKELFAHLLLFLNRRLKR